MTNSPAAGNEPQAVIVERELKISEPSDGPWYPQAESHTWGEFACLAIELGGYSDISAVDPYSGRRFWLADALRCDEHTAALRAAEPGDAAMKVYATMHGCKDCYGTSVITGIRRLLDAMEKAGFPDKYRG